MSPEQFLPEIEEDLDPAEIGTGCLVPTGDDETGGTTEEDEDD